MMFQKLSEKLKSFLDVGIPGYDCIVKHRGEIVFRQHDGFIDPEKTKPVAGNELYYIYSCSKLITCTAAMQLHEKHLFHLDDALSMYMPEFKQMNVQTPSGIVPAKRQITIRNLFTMTAGLSYNLFSPSLQQAQKETDGKCPTRETMRYLAQEPLLFEPGESWHYSLCHDVLAALVEILSGQSFNDYVTQNIFVPLGMTHSTFLPTQKEMDSVIPEYKGTESGIVPYTTLSPESNRFRNIYRFGEEYASGGAGCVSSVEDYSLFLEALRLGDSIISEESVRLMTTPQLTPEQLSAFTNKDIFSYGLGFRCPDERHLRSDCGWGGAAGALAAFDKTFDYSIFYAQHVLGSPIQQERIKLPPLCREVLE